MTLIKTIKRPKLSPKLFYLVGRFVDPKCIWHIGQPVKHYSIKGGMRKIDGVNLREGSYY